MVTPGGIYALVQAMETLARKTGVHILTGQRVEQIVTRNGRVAGLHMEGGRMDDCP